MARKWWMLGLFYGTSMFVFVGILMPIASDEILTMKRLLFSLAMWEVFGLIFGWIVEQSNKPKMEKN